MYFVDAGTVFVGFSACEITEAVVLCFGITVRRVIEGYLDI